MSPATLFRLALLQLRREGRRTVLGMACIAFGVLTLVAMQLLGTAITGALDVPPDVVLGGDVRLQRRSGPLTPQHQALLQRLQTRGDLRGLTFTASPGATFLRRQGSGRVHFLNRVLAVDPGAWPLVGTMPRLEGAPWPGTLTGPSDALVTADLAAKAGLRIGDSFTVASSSGGAVRTYRLRAIAPALPDQRGATVLLRRGDLAPDAALVTALLPRTAQALERAGWAVVRPQRLAGEAFELVRSVLVGAGLLGLALGGLGIANTVVVTLARRRRELATLAALGYGPGVRAALLTTELALVGLGGGVAGSLLGVAVAAGLARLFAEVSTFTVVLRVPPSVLLAGALTGTVAAALFGASAVIRASAVRPAAALRELPGPAPRRTLLRAALVGVVPIVLFTGLAGVVLGSLLKGLIVVGFGVGGLAVLAGVMLACLQPIVRLPVPGLPLLRLSQRALRGAGFRVGFALAALFAGTYAVGLAGMVFSTGARQAQTRSGGSGADLYVIGADEAGARRALATLRPDTLRLQLSLSAPVQSTGARPVAARLVARPGGDAAWDLKLASGALTGVLAPASRSSSVRPGETVFAQLPQGRVPLRVTGTYETRRYDPVIGTGFDLIVPLDVLRRLGTPVTNAGASGGGALAPDAATRVGTLLPDAFVFPRADFVEAMDGIFRALLRFAQALAALALGAGVVLIANAVALVLLERRRDFGVMQALGYRRRHVLGALVAEHALLGLVSGAAAVGAVALTANRINAQFPVASLQIEPGQALVLVGLSVVLAAGTAALVAWGPLRARPLEALRAA